MLRIRHEQLAVFEAAAQDRFLDAMTFHLRTFFAAAVEGMSDGRLRSIVSSLLERASTYGLTSEQDACRYLNIAATYGWDFDRDPEWSWMNKILTDPGISTPGERLKYLVDRCLARADQAENARRLEEEFRSGAGSPHRGLRE